MKTAGRDRDQKTDGEENGHIQFDPSRERQPARSSVGPVLPHSVLYKSRLGSFVTLCEQGERTSYLPEAMLRQKHFRRTRSSPAALLRPTITVILACDGSQRAIYQTPARVYTTTIVRTPRIPVTQRSRSWSDTHVRHTRNVHGAIAFADAGLRCPFGVRTHSCPSVPEWGCA